MRCGAGGGAWARDDEVRRGGARALMARAQRRRQGAATWGDTVVLRRLGQER